MTRDELKLKQVEAILDGKTLNIDYWIHSIMLGLLTTNQARIAAGKNPWPEKVYDVLRVWIDEEKKWVDIEDLE